MNRLVRAAHQRVRIGAGIDCRDRGGQVKREHEAVMIRRAGEVHVAHHRHGVLAEHAIDLLNVSRQAGGVPLEKHAVEGKASLGDGAHHATAGLAARRSSRETSRLTANRQAVSPSPGFSRVSAIATHIEPECVQQSDLRYTSSSRQTPLSAHTAWRTRPRDRSARHRPGAGCAAADDRSARVPRCSHTRRSRRSEHHHRASPRPTSGGRSSLQPTRCTTHGH